MGKIPDRLDPGFYQALRDLRCFGLRDRESRDLYFIVDNKLLQVIDPTDLDSADHKTDQARVDIEHSLDHKAALLKICIVGDRLT